MGLKDKVCFNAVVYKNQIAICAVACLVVIAGAIICILLFVGHVNVTADANSIVAKGTWESTKAIKYDDIKSVELRDNFDIGSKEDGLVTFKVAAGIFHNHEFGDYTIYADKDCKQFIVITLKNDEIVVVNGNDAASTTKLFNKIEKIVSSST